MSTPAIDIDKLAPEERLQLIGDLWESLRRTPEDVPLTLAQAAELDRRLDGLERGGVGLVSREDVKLRLTARLG
jgi:putative addiction module component (TIGR02574 family)